MSERNDKNLPFDSDDRDEQALWAALGEMPIDEPSPSLRRGFYRELDEASQETVYTRLRRLLGFESNVGWLTAAASVLVGFVIAGGLDGAAPGGSSTANERLATLENNVAMLNRELILDRLDHSNAGTRLRGVLDARYAADDEAIVEALLMRASGDRVPSVRSAAIDVLGDNLLAPGIGDALMELLETTDAPTVQLALVNLVLRNGTREQLERLRELADADQLHPDLIRHVRTAMGSERV